MLPQNLRHLWCCLTKLHILEWSFIAPSTRCTCVMIMLFNQLLDIPHLSGGWIILAKEKMLTNRNVNKFLHRILKKYTFLGLEHFWNHLFQRTKHGTNTLHVAFLYFFCIYTNPTLLIVCLESLRKLKRMVDL